MLRFSHATHETFTRMLARARTAPVEFTIHLRCVSKRQHSMTRTLSIAKRHAPDLAVRGRGIGDAIGICLRVIGGAAFGGRAAT